MPPRIDLIVGLPESEQSSYGIVTVIWKLAAAARHLCVKHAIASEEVAEPLTRAVVRVDCVLKVIISDRHKLRHRNLATPPAEYGHSAKHVHAPPLADRWPRRKGQPGKWTKTKLCAIRNKRQQKSVLPLSELTCTRTHGSSTKFLSKVVYGFPPRKRICQGSAFHLRRPWTSYPSKQISKFDGKRRS